MNKRTQYLIANDGTIVTIEQPNCRTCGQLVSTDAAYCPHCGTPVNSAEVTEVKNGNRKYKVWIWILALSLAVAIVVAFALNDDLENAHRRNSEYWEELHPFKCMVRDVDSPILISKIEIKNADEDYNDIIYARNTTFLYGKIYYYSIKTKDITLKIKLYQDDRLRNGDKYYDCSFTQECSIIEERYSCCDLSGWGKSTKGFWPAGDYRYEVWYEDQCLGVKYFKIY